MFNVLSLFDGMSCGQIALKELGIVVDNYFSSEVDKYAIKQTQHNFPKTIQLGDVTKVKANDLPKIDLLIGGSPCQGFSFAGKQLNFEDPRSKLFFEFVRIWNEIKKINPDAKFLLENVNMKKEYLRIISEYVGVFPVRINSNLVSAQDRSRWYWTNIKTKEVGLFRELWTDIPQPEDKNIFFKDIKEHIVGKVINLTPSRLKMISLSQCLDKRQKSYAVTTKQDRSALSGSSFSYCSNIDGNYRYLSIRELCRLQTIPEWYEWIVSDIQIYKMLGNGWTVDVIKHIFSFISHHPATE